MGLFDLIGEDTTSVVTATTSSSQGSSIGGSTTGGDDSNFLIINETVTKGATPIIQEIKSSDIPDSAISFFEDSPKSESLSITEPSVKQETIQIKDSPAENTITFLDNSNEKSASIFASGIQESKEVEIIKETNIIAPTQLETSGSILFGTETINTPSTKEVVSDLVSKKEEIQKGDPNTILLEAIDDLKKLLSGHESIIEDKMSVIEKKQGQIASLKQEIKTLTEEAKVIGEEKNKVIKMIELFQSQKV